MKRRFPRQLEHLEVRLLLAVNVKLGTAALEFSQAVSVAISTPQLSEYYDANDLQSEVDTITTGVKQHVANIYSGFALVLMGKAMRMRL